MKKVYIVILHFGDINTTKKCIASLIKNERQYNKIIVVNNNVASISSKDFLSTTIHVINNNKNLGFAGGVNIGIQYALSQKATHVYLLNNDTIISSALLPSLLDVFSHSDDVGIVAPAISFKKNRKKLFDIGGKFNAFLGRTSHEEVSKILDKSPHKATYVSGCAMVIDSNVFRKIGLFDEKFFLYYEDVDFCLRAKKAGFLCAVNPSVVIEHELSKSAGKGSSFAVYHQTRSGLLFGDKYYKKWYQKIINKTFLLLQTSKIILNNPRGGMGGAKALLG